MKKNRLFIVFAAVVVVAGVAGYAALTGIYPPRTGTEGAIGAASRYQAPQISDTDVNLQDESVQAFLQSDMFYKLSTNATFRKAVTNRKAIEQLKSLYAKSTVQDGAEIADLMKTSKALNQVAGDELFKKAVKEQEVVDLAAKLVSYDKKSKLDKAATADVMAKIQDVFKKAGVSELDSKSQVFSSKAFVGLMAKGQAADLLANRDLVQLLSDADLGELFADGDLAGDLMSKNVVEAMKKAPVELLSKSLATTQPRKATIQPRKATSQP
jgi:hypothetical protein